MKTLIFTNEFKKELKLAKKRGKNIEKLLSIVHLLKKSEKIPEKHRLHTLGEEFKGCHELHVEPDWLLIFKLTQDSIVLLRTGPHSDLFS